MVCVGLLVRQYGKNRTRTNPTTSFFLYDFGGSDKSRFLWFGWRSSLLGTGVLGDSLGSFADCVLGQFSGQEESDGRLDFSARDGRAAIVVCQTRRLGCDALEDVVDERVHDRHGLAADAGVRVDLFQHLVDVDGIALLSPPLVLLVSGTCGLRLAGGLLCSLTCWFRRHYFDNRIVERITTADRKISLYLTTGG